MARRPGSENPEIFTEKDLSELRHNLAHLSIDGVRRYYQRAHGDCRMIYDRLPPPKQMQTLMQVWKQLWSGGEKDRQLIVNAPDHEVVYPLDPKEHTSVVLSTRTRLRG